MLFISHCIPESSPTDPRYAKGLLDFIFVAYHIIFFSFIRQFSLFYFIHPIARLLGVRKIAKVERFGEQGYAVLYYGTMGLWGCVRADSITLLNVFNNDIYFEVHHVVFANLVVQYTILLDRYVSSMYTIILLMVNRLRLSALGHATNAKAILLNASVVLVTTVDHPRSQDRETKKGLFGTIRASSCYIVVDRVRIWRLGSVFYTHA